MASHGEDPNLRKKWQQVVPAALGGAAAAGDLLIGARADHIHDVSGLATGSHNHDASYSLTTHTHTVLSSGLSVRRSLLDGFGPLELQTSDTDISRPVRLIFHHPAFSIGYIQQKDYVFSFRNWAGVPDGALMPIDSSDVRMNGVTVAPGTHASRHTGGADPITPGAIGASPIGHTHTPTGMVLLGQTTLVANQTVVTFSSIPSTYKHLMILSDARSSGAGTGIVGLLMNYNGDYSAAYHYQVSVFTGASLSAFQALGQTTLAAGGVCENGVIGGAYCANQITIFNYSTFVPAKNMISTAGGLEGAISAGKVFFNSGTWYNGNIITSVSLQSQVGDFLAGSRFSLFGML